MLDSYYLKECIPHILKQLDGLSSEDFEELIDIFENSTNEFVQSIICNKNNKELSAFINTAVKKVIQNADKKN